MRAALTSAPLCLYFSPLLLRLPGRAGVLSFNANLAPFIFHLVDDMLGNGGLRSGWRLHRKSPLVVARLRGKEMHCIRQKPCKSGA